MNYSKQTCGTTPVVNPSYGILDCYEIELNEIAIIMED